jgi:Putative MetA-pathway of phenol degradation
MIWRLRAFVPFVSLIFMQSALPRHLSAQDDLTVVPNRPTVSTPAQPVRPGILETEWGVDAASSHQDMNGLLKFGLSKNFELRFANNPITADSGTHGVGDTALGFKYRLTQDSGNEPSISLMYMAKLPTAGNILGSGEVDHSFTLLLSKDLGKHHFDYNLIANLLGRPPGGFDRSYLNALAWSHPVRGKWSMTAELAGVTSANAFNPASAQFLASALYTVRTRLVLDIGMSARIAGEVPHVMFVAGLTYSIADLYGRPHHFMN